MSGAAVSDSPCFIKISQFMSETRSKTPTQRRQDTGDDCIENFIIITLWELTLDGLAHGLAHKIDCSSALRGPRPTAENESRQRDKSPWGIQ